MGEEKEAVKVKKEKRTGARLKGFFKGLILGIIIGAILMCVYSSALKINFSKKINSGKEFVDMLINGNAVGYTSADFSDAILGEASEHQEFIVMEQPLEITSTLTKAGLGNFAIFSKTKNITYSGTGVFTVDLSRLNSDCITVDEEAKFVDIAIPRPVLQYVILDPDGIQFEDTEKGLLAFGDIKMKAEEQNAVETEVKNRMTERLSQKDIKQKAEMYALSRCKETFGPLVNAISDEYTVGIKFIN